jgi:hypothetical protein
MLRVGQNHDTRCIYGISGREITKYTVIYGVYIQFWPTLHMRIIRNYTIMLLHYYTPFMMHADTKAMNDSNKVIANGFGRVGQAGDANGATPVNVRFLCVSYSIVSRVYQFV